MGNPISFFVFRKEGRTISLAEIVRPSFTNLFYQELMHQQQDTSPSTCLHSSFLVNRSYSAHQLL